MEELIKTATACAAITYIVCDTGAIEAYLKLFCKWFKVKNDVINPPQDLGINFITRLRMTHGDNFFVELFECPVCLGSWIAIAASVGLSVIAIGSTVFLTWVGYFLLKLLVGLINKNESGNSRKV